MAYTEFYIQTTGDNLNSGSSSADAATNTYTGCNFVNATRVFTRPSGSFITDGITVGDWVSVYADGATTTTYVAQVELVDALTVTLHATKKAGTAIANQTGTANMKKGGAWAQPTVLTNFGTSIDLRNTADDVPRINIKAGSYTRLSVAIATIGCITASNLVIEGYTTTVGDGGYATIQGPASGAAISLITVGNFIEIRRHIFDGNGTSGTQTGVTISGSNSVAFRCVFKNMRASGLAVSGSACSIISCEAYANNVADSASHGGFNISGESKLINCVATANKRANYLNSGSVVEYYNCIAANGVATSGHGWSSIAATGHLYMVGCTSVGNLGFGINIGADHRNIDVINCLIANNAGDIGINTSSQVRHTGRFLNNAFYGQTTQINNASSFDGIEGSVTLASDPFTGKTPANGEFTPTSVVAGVGYGAFVHPSLTTTSTASVVDAGAVQIAASAGGLMLPLSRTGGLERW